MTATDDRLRATDDRLRAAAEHAARMLGLPHPPTVDELADLFAPEDAAPAPPPAPYTVACACCGGTGRVRMGAAPRPLADLPQDGSGGER